MYTGTPWGDADEGGVDSCRMVWVRNTPPGVPRGPDGTITNTPVRRRKADVPEAGAHGKQGRATDRDDMSDDVESHTVLRVRLDAVTASDRPD